MKLPSALKTANLLVLHVFRLHGIPQEIVSDQVPSSPLRCERLSAWHWGPQLVSPLVITHRPRARWSGPIRVWSPPCAVWLPTVRPPGLLICRELNMTQTPWSAHPLVCCPSWSCVVSSPLCSPVRSLKWQSPGQTIHS